MALFLNDRCIAPSFGNLFRQSFEKQLPPLAPGHRLLPNPVKVIHSGFTLFEIIVALFIFSILITAVFKSFRSISSNAEALQREDAFYEMAQGALSQMIKDLESIYVTRLSTYKPPGLKGTHDPYRLLGDSSALAGEQFSKLQFSSFEHLAINGDETTGISQLIYYGHRVGANQFVLRRSDHIRPPELFKESGDDPVLCETLKSLKFRYYDAAGEIHDHWDSDASEFDNATPRAIEIQLEIGDESGSVFLGTLVALPAYRDKIAK
jgi:general secretion pathway protein J